ncbi:ATP synthase F1 subunit epsilon [Clostridium manihotivorum]|uniref:ATP synthase epsilon chain n=1 Tax=Clostridium manihotivorum TaxID=2320868 RepID=A0A410DQY9_9CLOT|nr:ATP synthase F1 subunit epsilon [Clostridium manihotivorum]QAA31440.1 ATP synthase F1 subunit epsilon [Clostridium manihotivorum]
MNTFNLHLITPNREIFSGDIVKILSKNSDGEFEVYANHISYITNTIPTVTKFVDADNKEYSLFTSTGIVQFKDNQLIFACDSAEWPEEIDASRAEQAKERAEKRLQSSVDVDTVRAQVALARAMARLQLKK